MAKARWTQLPAAKGTVRVYKYRIEVGETARGTRNRPRCWESGRAGSVIRRAPAGETYAAQGHTLLSPASHGPADKDRAKGAASPAWITAAGADSRGGGTIKRACVGRRWPDRQIPLPSGMPEPDSNILEDIQRGPLKLSSPYTHQN